MENKLNVYDGSINLRYVILIVIHLLLRTLDAINEQIKKVVSLALLQNDSKDTLDKITPIHLCDENI